MRAGNNRPTVPVERSLALVDQIMRATSMSQRRVLRAAGLSIDYLRCDSVLVSTEKSLVAVAEDHGLVPVSRYEATGMGRPPANAVLQLRAEPWMAGANCRGMRPEDRDAIFICADSPSGWGAVFPNEATAKLLCSACVVREECLEYAYRTKDRHAILGGLTPLERKTLRRTRRKTDQLSMEVS